MARNVTTHFIASLYTFSDAAKSELCESFVSASKASKASCEHTNDDQFIVQCSMEDDQAVLVFIGLMKHYIQAEVDKELEIFEEVKIKRLTGTRKKTAIDLADESMDHTELPEPHLMDDDVQDQLIEHENVVQKWQISKENESDRAGLNFNSILLSKIGSLTNCRVELGANEVEVVIKGDTEQDVARVISKLNVLRNSAAVSSRTWDFQMFEGETDMILQMVSLKYAKGRKLSTTIFPQTFPNLKLLPNYLIVEKVQETVAVQPGQQVPQVRNPLLIYAVCRLWKDHPHKPYGDITHNDELYDHKPAATILMKDVDLISEVEDHSAMSAVDKWVEQSSMAVTANPFVPPGEVEEASIEAAMPHHAEIVKSIPTPAPEPLPASTSASTSVHEPKPEPERRWIRTRQVKVRTARGVAAEPEAEIAESTAASSEIPAFPAISDNTSSSQTKLSSKVAENIIVPLVPDVPYDTASSQKSFHSSIAEDRLKEMFDGLEFPVSAAATEEADHTTHHSPLRPPPIEPPYMPEPSKASTQTSGSTSKSRPAWTRKVAQDVKTGNLIDMSVPHVPNVGVKKKGSGRRGVKTDVVEHVQSVSKAVAPKLKETMSQRAGASRADNVSATSLQAFQVAATEIFEWSRSRQGLVKLEVNIGRVLIDYQTGSSEFKRKAFTVGQWPSVFTSKEGTSNFGTSFTEMLTTLAADADFISNLKLPSSRRLFAEEAYERKVTYDVICKTKGGEHIVVKIDQEGKYKIRSSNALIGALNWHFPKRSWDARLAVTSYEDVDTKYEDAIKGIVDNLKISTSTDGKSLRLFTKTISSELRIHSIILRRETFQHCPLYPDIVLRLCEVQDLGLQSPAGSRSEYHGSTPSQHDIAEATNKVWWEASLLSLTATKILRENETLELGEVATWNPIDIIDQDVVNDLSGVANDLVTRIDKVGELNHGPRAESIARISIRGAANAGFW